MDINHDAIRWLETSREAASWRFREDTNGFAPDRHLGLLFTLKDIDEYQDPMTWYPLDDEPVRRWL
ncbi:hypothetical protein [Nonomuraea dietziae]|uniref:hypothetical protein n=1 Tax=Nonomuraea dietziae TaxID=65515 RepID=UPI0033D98CD8